MPIIEFLILTIILILITVLVLSVRLIFTKKGEFRGGSCSTQLELKKHGISCVCGHDDSCS